MERGWLKKQIERVKRDYDQWPEWKKRAAEYDRLRREKKRESNRRKRKQRDNYSWWPLA